MWVASFPKAMLRSPAIRSGIVRHAVAPCMLICVKDAIGELGDGVHVYIYAWILPKSDETEQSVARDRAEDM